ncbi:MAG TPA: protein kinase [Kofleriaceae bacterium]|nr:protein kinase [Kofleriaceae bacterium]
MSLASSTSTKELDMMNGRQVGSWVLQRLLGTDGTSEVYLAEHVVMKDLWVVRVLSEGFSRQEEVVIRLVSEARAVAKERHRNLARVFQIDRTPNDGPWYMVLEYLEGRTLAHFIASQAGPIAYDLIVRILCQVASALHAIHRQGIVHRDLKPENIVLLPRENDDFYRIVLDLGAMLLGGGSSKSASGIRDGVIGSCYNAPEQILGEKVKPSADVYALGVLAYEMSTGGWRPYQGEHESRDTYARLSPGEFYRRQASGPPLDPRQRNPGMSDAWAKVVLSLLEVDPARRIPTARVAAIELAKAAPTDGLGDDGLALVRTYAGDLLQAEHPFEATIRSPPQPVICAPGTEVRYVLGRALGAGGMAEVFSGNQIGEQGFERPVAIKRVLADLSVRPGFSAMFISEARIASRLAHPNIVSVIDFRRDDQGRLFLVMEYVDGRDLRALLAAGPLPPSTAIFVIVEVLRGLGYAHDRKDPVTGCRGIIHRDVSPHNVLLSYEGEVKVSDFGLARVRDGDGPAGPARLAGKPCYMSPEQVQGEPLNHRSDLWAVGVMLWEMLACQPMFTGTTREVIGQVLFKTITLPSRLRPDVPADLEAVAMKLLERKPEARYATAGAVISALLHCRDAPLNGRDELADQLAARFPSPAVGAHRRSSVAAATPRAVPAIRTEQPTVSAVPSLLDSSAISISLKGSCRPRRPSALLWVVPSCLAIGTAVGAMGFRQSQGSFAPPTNRASDGLPATLHASRDAAVLNSTPAMAPARTEAAAGSISMDGGRTSCPVANDSLMLVLAAPIGAGRLFAADPIVMWDRDGERHLLHHRVLSGRCPTPSYSSDRGIPIQALAYLRRSRF